MTDAISAITTSPTLSQDLSYEQISPEDLARFENEYKGEETQFPSIDAIDETDFSDKLLHYIMEIDKGYQNLVSNNEFSPKINTITESDTLQQGNLELEHFDFSPPSTNNFETMMKSLQETHYKVIDAQAWSLQLQAVLTSGTMMTKALGSLLKSG